MPLRGVRPDVFHFNAAIAVHATTIEFPRNTQYTIPFPIPPERVIQELELFANPAEQAYPGKQASTSTTRSHHASQLFWSASQLFWSVRSRQCLLFGLASQPVVVCFCCLVCCFWCYTKQTKQQLHKTPIVFLLRWFFGALSSSSLVL